MGRRLTIINLLFFLLLGMYLWYVQQQSFSSFLIYSQIFKINKQQRNVQLLIARSEIDYSSQIHQTSIWIQTKKGPRNTTYLLTNMSGGERTSGQCEFFRYRSMKRKAIRPLDRYLYIRYWLSSNLVQRCDVSMVITQSVHYLCLRQRSWVIYSVLRWTLVSNWGKFISILAPQHLVSSYFWFAMTFVVYAITTISQFVYLEFTNRATDIPFMSLL